MRLLRFLASAAHESHLVLEIRFHKFLNWCWKTNEFSNLNSSLSFRMFEINFYFHGMPMCTLCAALRFFFGRPQVKRQI
jgi:hypothetical protein